MEFYCALGAGTLIIVTELQYEMWILSVLWDVKLPACKIA